MKKEQQLYRVVKIYDFTDNRPMYETRMYGQAAFPHNPTKECQKIMSLSNESERLAAIKEYTGERDMWTKTASLDPIIGFPVFFLSVKLGAGWWRSAPVTQFAHYKGTQDRLPCTIMKTETGLYLVQVDD